MSADFVEARPVQKPPYRTAQDILEGQSRGGRGVIERAEWARLAFEGLRSRCTHVPEEELVRLFSNRGQSQLELIQGAAVFKEYNATHPSGPRRKAKGRPKPGARRPPPAAAPPARPAAAAKQAPPRKPAKAAERPRPAARSAPARSKPAPRKAAPVKAKRRR